MCIMSQRKVLVLNRSSVPIKIVPLIHAMKKITSVYRDGTPKARIIDAVHDFAMLTWEDWKEMRPKEGELAMHSVNAIFRIPEVIQYTKYDKIPKRVSYNRKTIFRRDNNCCQYCGKHKPGNELSIDHVVPKCQGGLTDWENVVVACTECNAKKAGRTPQQANMKLLSVPKKPVRNFFSADIKIKSWEQFFSEAYFLVELENDMKN